MIGLVRIVSADPAGLSTTTRCWPRATTRTARRSSLRICDPNWPRADDVTITFDTADPMGVMTPTWSKQETHELQCFFTYAYQAIDPAPFRG